MCMCSGRFLQLDASSDYLSPNNQSPGRQIDLKPRRLVNVAAVNDRGVAEGARDVLRRSRRLRHHGVPCVRRGGVRFMINGHDYFNLVLVTNVAGAGSIKSMDVKSSDSADWMPMARNWGANWHSMAYLSGKMLSFRVIITDGQTLVFTNVVPAGWTFGMTFASNLQFKPSP
ncbi:hypothetical protein HU200_012861 [Digitaria exilis]|uniref:Expansin n=1 Tax=Digitaria exilis TaxID=1010633 RepID=A0A835FE56_9POAL|nr:hypothetical protein HU200_012861 [Digitaria exilis]